MSTNFSKNMIKSSEKRAESLEAEMLNDNFEYVGKQVNS
jgi:hypothetical protein